MSFRVFLGWIATIAWVVLWGGFVFTGWEKASAMNFNEWGDFFAGVFAPLAFLWLVIGYFQQGEELGLNTKALLQQEAALQLQVKELKNSVEQQAEMVKVTNASLIVTKDNADREHHRARQQVRPNFSQVRCLSSIEGKTGFTFIVEALNSGSNITQVIFEPTKADNNLFYIPVNLSSWENGVKKRLNFRCETGVSQDTFLDLTIHYTDSLGERDSQVMYFTGENRDKIAFTM